MDRTAPHVFIFPELPLSWESAVLPVDKPTGVSSFGVIRRLRRLIGVRKIGHAGTLDPLATGLLIMLVGRATRRMEEYMGLDKQYVGTIRLGETTPSFDSDTAVEHRVDAAHVTDRDLEDATRPFIGTVTQQTPIYSAVKVGGERLYKKARRGEAATPPPRIVTISRFEITGRRGNDVDFVVDCSKGTYVRSIAHEFGAALGVGGHLVALRRTAIGPVRVEQAWTLEALSLRSPGNAEAEA